MNAKPVLCLAAALALALTGIASAGQPAPPEATERPAELDQRPAVSFDVLTTATRQELQSRLAERGYYEGPIDGLIDPATREALSDFQRAHGLEATGYLDPPTARTLGLEIFIEPGDEEPMV